MIIIVEGADFTGKTTFVNDLCEATGLPVIKPYNKHDTAGLYSLNDEIKKYGFSFNDFPEDLLGVELIKQLGVNAIFDRNLVSAKVYRIMDVKPKISDFIYHWWMRRFFEIGGIYIFVDTCWGWVDRFRKNALKNPYSRIKAELYNKTRFDMLRSLFNIFFEEIQKAAVDYNCSQIVDTKVLVRRMTLSEVGDPDDVRKDFVRWTHQHFRELLFSQEEKLEVL